MVVHPYDIRNNSDILNMDVTKFIGSHKIHDIKGYEEAISGDTALWLKKKSYKWGVKIIPNMTESQQHTIKSICSLPNSPLPQVYDIFLSPKNSLIIVMDFVPPDKTTSNQLANCIEWFYNNNILPDDDWSKQINIHKGKIVDFHNFKYFPIRYKFPDKENIAQTVYERALSRYKKMGNDKWKGKIYQGMNFTDYSMKGYSSNGKMYDSYHKLPFTYLNKSLNSHVLDLGCNEGFFSIQAAIHGAASVDAIDLCPEDIALANDIKKIVQFEGCDLNFISGNAVEFIKKTEKYYNLTFLLSVLHQIYKNMEGSEIFLRNIAKKTNYLVYETPIEHPLMNIGIKKIIKNLKQHFQSVRHLYTYDAYSSGKRAIMICF